MTTPTPPPKYEPIAFVRIRAPRQRFPGQSHVDDVTAVQYIKAPCNISCL